MKIPIIIPAYEPDDRLTALLKELDKAGLGPIVLVDDGSGKEYERFFPDVTGGQCSLLKHAENLGKGRALKDAFNYLLNEGDVDGCVTVDSDGQHGVEDIKKCMEAFENNPQTLVLGSRNFDLPNVPLKSRIGNKLTHHVCKWLCGVDVADTQTGLRVIPENFMRRLLNTPGERFEFETNMLLESRGRVEIAEVPIETLYDSPKGHKTHFDPIKDSIRIYKIFAREFCGFLLSSMSSGLIDLALFAAFCGALKNMGLTQRIVTATCLARILSAIYNYTLNYKVVFKSDEKHKVSAAKYFALAAVQMGLSAFFVSVGTSMATAVPKVAVKAVVDVVLFFAGYKIQQEHVFQNTGCAAYGADRKYCGRKSLEKVLRDWGE